MDADHGYGNALNVRRTVEELETAGVAALTIEDTNLPQPFGAVGSTQVLSIDEGAGKMRAALSGRQDPVMVIAARTSAATINGLDDAIARGKAYQEVGVDAIFLQASLKTIRWRPYLPHFRSRFSLAVPEPVFWVTASSLLNAACGSACKGIILLWQLFSQRMRP